MHDNDAEKGQGSPDTDQGKTPEKPDELAKDNPRIKRNPYPPDSIPDPMPGVDRQQTPGTDH